MHFDSSSFACSTSTDAALNRRSNKKFKIFQSQQGLLLLQLHCIHNVLMFCQKYTLLTHTSFHTKVKKIENTFLITFQIPLLSIGIMYKLQHDGLLHAEHATIFKATLRSFSGGEVKTYSLYDTGGQMCHVSGLQ